MNTIIHVKVFKYVTTKQNACCRRRTKDRTWVNEFILMFLLYSVSPTLINILMVLASPNDMRIGKVGSMCRRVPIAPLWVESAEKSVCGIWRRLGKLMINHRWFVLY